MSRMMEYQSCTIAEIYLGPFSWDGWLAPQGRPDHPSKSQEVGRPNFLPSPFFSNFCMNFFRHHFIIVAYRFTTSDVKDMNELDEFKEKSFSY